MEGSVPTEPRDACAHEAARFRGSVSLQNYAATGRIYKFTRTRQTGTVFVTFCVSRGYQSSPH
jgi:hypothetical protein